MEKYQVKPIDEMIRAYPKVKNEHDNVEIIVITRGGYDYPFKPLLELYFDDVTKQDISEMDSDAKNQFTFIQQEHVDSIVEKLPEIKKAGIVYVCCDAGISRSPAVASALAHYLGDAKSYGRIVWKYPFLNRDVFESLLIGLRNSLNNRR